MHAMREKSFLGRRDSERAKRYVHSLTLFTAACPRPKLDYPQNDRYRSEGRFLRILHGDA